MDRVDEMSQDIVKYNTYMRNTSKQQQQKHQYQQRRQQENMQRQSRGEPHSQRKTCPSSSNHPSHLPGWTPCSLQAKLILTARTSRSLLPRTWANSSWPRLFKNTTTKRRKFPEKELTWTLQQLLEEVYLYFLKHREFL